MNRKIIAMDLDGSLLNENGIISNISMEYLKKLKKEGHIIVIATGRILNSAKLATKGADFANYIVGNAGAAVYKNDENNKWIPIYEKLIPYKVAESFFKYFNENEFSHISLCNSEKIYRYTKNFDKDDKVVINLKNEEEIKNNIKSIIHVSIGFRNNDLVKKYKEKFCLKYPELKISIMQDSFREKQWIEITQKDVEKYKGISKIADIEKIKNEDIISFGDGLNDLEMIEKSGIGVAMKNALPQVKQIANFITEKNNQENGIIEFLKTMVFEKK